MKSQHGLEFLRDRTEKLCQKFHLDRKIATKLLIKQSIHGLITVMTRVGIYTPPEPALFRLHRLGLQEWLPYLSGAYASPHPTHSHRLNMDINSESLNSSSVEDFREQIVALQSDSAALRRHARHSFERPVSVYSGTVSEDSNIHGSCFDISQSGLGAILDAAPAVGEHMWLVIDDFEPAEDPIHAQCMRARLLPTSEFEVGFVFLSLIDLPTEYL